MVDKNQMKTKLQLQIENVLLEFRSIGKKKSYYEIKSLKIYDFIRNQIYGLTNVDVKFF